MEYGMKFPLEIRNSSSFTAFKRQCPANTSVSDQFISVQ